VEPITLAIVGALANLTNAAIKDAYEGLKGFIIKKYGEQSKITQAVGELEVKPDSQARQAVLNEEIVTARAHQDGDLQNLVNDLLKRLEQFPGAQNSVNQQIKGNHNIVAGIGSINVNKE
jgi:hypothetical protein